MFGLALPISDWVTINQLPLIKVVAFRLFELNDLGIIKRALNLTHVFCHGLGSPWLVLRGELFPPHLLVIYYLLFCKLFSFSVFVIRTPETQLHAIGGCLGVEPCHFKNHCPPPFAKWVKIKLGVCLALFLQSFNKFFFIIIPFFHCWWFSVAWLSCLDSTHLADSKVAMVAKSKMVANFIMKPK
jgi:hypothetical protein